MNIQIVRKKKYFNKLKQNTERLLIFVFMFIGLIATLQFAINTAKEWGEYYFKERLSVGGVVEARAETVPFADQAGSFSVNSEDKEDFTPPSPRELVKKYFGNDKTAVAVMMCESMGDPDRIGDLDKTYWKNGKIYGDSIGLFQIRTFEGRPDREQLKDPEFNVKYAKELYEKSNWQPWSCWNNKRYKLFLI